MKKRLLVGLLSVAALALNGSAAQAWLFSRCCGCSKYSTYLCVRPYNAFSPVCFGSITATGCCPMIGCGMPCGMPGGMGCGPCGPCGPSSCMPSCFSGCAPSYASSGCCDSGCLPPPGAIAGAPQAPPQNIPLSPMPNGPSSQNYTPPMPSPLSPTSQRWPAQMPYGYGAVQPVGYQANYGGYQPAYSPGYYPGYYPGYTPGYYPGYYPTTPSYTPPNYWYGAGQ